MRRREFIALLGSAAAAWPLAARAQPAGGLRRIGVLLGGTEGDSQAVAGLATVKKALAELGWTDGRNIQLDYRWGGADVARTQAVAKELIALKPDLILSQTTPATAALQRQTRTIPIVFVVVSDPVGSGFVASFPRPGGNITGFVNIEGSVSGKWIEVLKDIVPGVNRATLLYNPDTATYFSYYLQPFEAAARSNAIEPIAAPVRATEDIERVVTGLGNRTDAGLVVMPDIFLQTARNRDLILSLAARTRVPTIYPYRYIVAAGGLISYGVDNADLWRRSAAYIDRILRGAKPADLPVQLPTKFELAVNLKTAAALGLNMSREFLLLADEVIE
jgi:putative tryptophan/tyrosine transport system substrate-binding protein